MGATRKQFSRLRVATFRIVCVIGLVQFGLPVTIRAQFAFTTNNGAITITGYTGPGGAVIIPNTTNGLPVTTIGNGAFNSSSILTNVIIPNGIISIGSGAFTGCTNLLGVTIGGSVTSILDGAFYDCSRLTSVHIPDSVASIGTAAFYQCGSLNSVALGTNLASIQDGAFNYCTSLTNVMLPASVTNLGNLVFYSCTKLRAITVDANNLVFGSVAGVLFNKSHTSLLQYPLGKAGSAYVIPNGVTNIGEGAFAGSTSLTGANIPDNVISIGTAAFNLCLNLEIVTIGSGVTRIGNYAFDACPRLTTINVNTTNSSYSSLDGVLYDKNWTALIKYPADRAGFAYQVTDSVARIGPAAFAACKLVSVTIPGSVILIADYAFVGCYTLTGAYMRGHAPDVGQQALIGANNATVYYLPGTTGWDTTFGGRPTAPWLLPYPVILPGGSNFGVRTNRFGFTISWATNNPVVVEACTNLVNPVWSPLRTNTLTSGTAYFGDPDWTNYPARFYRIRSP